MTHADWRDPRGLCGRARQANTAGQRRRAIDLCTVGLNQAPQSELDAALRLERAAAFLALNDWARAESDCRQALLRHPSARAHVLLARCLLIDARSSAALLELEAALTLDAEPAATWLLYARALSAQGQHERAVAAGVAAQERDSSLETSKLQLQLLSAAGRHDELVARAERIVEQERADADVWTALGLSLNARGHSERATHALEQAVRLEPERVDAHFGLGTALCRRGRFAEGFRHLEYRQKDAGVCFRFGVPPWRGESLAGKRLLVWSEQGLGDIIQFARFVPLVRRSAAQTSFRVPSLLARLFRNTPELAATIETDHPGFGGADHQALLLSLPHVLRLGEGVREIAAPYLFAEPALVEQWRARLPLGRKVALAWQGNPLFAGEPGRSLPFSAFAPLLRQSDSSLTFLSLQKNCGSEQLRASPEGHRVLDLSAELDCGSDAFVDSLAVLSLSDLFITTDTSLAHLAGALGVRTWLLLCHAPDWRWGAESATTFWYPNTRLFRQSEPGDWAGVVSRVIEALTSLTAQPAGASHSGSKSIAECSIPPQVVATGA